MLPSGRSWHKETMLRVSLFKVTHGTVDLVSGTQAICTNTRLEAYVHLALATSASLLLILIYRVRGLFKSLTLTAQFTDAG